MNCHSIAVLINRLLLVNQIPELGTFWRPIHYYNTSFGETLI
jgi:hypothetical protein